MQTSETELASLLATRELWQLASAALTDPFHKERLESLRDPAARERVLAAARDTSEALDGAEAGPGELPPAQLDPAIIFTALDECEATLEPSYRAIFGFTISTSCPANEMEFEPNEDINWRAQRMADLGGFYRAFGLKVSPRHSERLDHAATLAEFYAYLCLKEAHALRTGLQEAAATCRDARRSFFSEHMGWWLPAFATLLNERTGNLFYRGVARFLAALSCAERNSHGIAPFQRAPAARPATPEPDSGCMGCQDGGQA